MNTDKTTEERRRECVKKLNEAWREFEMNTSALDLSQFIWNEENLMAYRQSLAENLLKPNDWSHKLFYVDPEGTLLQNELLIGLVVNYICGNVKEETLLELLLSHGKPVFRVKCMSETAPRSGEFVPMVFDLIEQIVKKKDSPLLKKLYHYIDLSQYKNFAEEIVALVN